MVITRSRLLLFSLVIIILSVSGAYIIYSLVRYPQLFEEHRAPGFGCIPSDGDRRHIVSSTLASQITPLRCNVHGLRSITYWVPSLNDVLEIDPVAARYIEEHGTGLRMPPLSQYFRQYVGYMNEGRKSVCVALIHEDAVSLNTAILRAHPENMAHLPRELCPEDHWRESRHAVSDGGWMFCGLVYEFTTQSISQLDCNGN